MRPTKKLLRDDTRNRHGYRVVVTRYLGRSMVVETIGTYGGGMLSWQEALKAVWKHGSTHHAELVSADDGGIMMTVAFGKASYVR